MLILKILLWTVEGFFALLFAYILLIIISAAVVNMKKEYDTNSRYYRFLLNSSTGIATKLIRIRLHVSGMEKLPEGSRFLMVSNHRSKFDPILCWYIFRKYDLSFISKPENFKVPIFGRLIHRLCFMPIDRENPRNALKTIVRAVDLINNDTVNVAVYPEGTRNYGEKLLPFHNAVFKIAQKANVPIVVITVKGADMIHKNYPLRRSDVYVDVVSVLDAPTVKGTKTAELGDQIADIMNGSLNSLQAHPRDHRSAP